MGERAPLTHFLKCDPQPFDDVRAGRKTFELRRDDRPFAVHDTVVLQQTRYSRVEMDGGAPLEFTGEVERRRITHMLRGSQYGLMDGWVVLSLEPASWRRLSPRWRPAANRHVVALHEGRLLVGATSISDKPEDEGLWFWAADEGGIFNLDRDAAPPSLFFELPALPDLTS